MQPFIVNLKGLSRGESRFEWEAGAEFFESFGNEDILDAQVRAEATVVNKGARIEVSCSLEGSVTVPCDRCLDDLVLEFSTGFEETPSRKDASMNLWCMLLQSMGTSRANIEQAYRPHSGVEWHFACSMRSKWRHRAGTSALQPPGMPLALLDALHEERFARRTMSKKNEPSREATEPGRLEIPLIGVVDDSLRGLRRSVFRRKTISG